MNVRRLTNCTTVAALAALLAVPALAQDAAKKEAPKAEAKKEGAAPAGMPSMEEMMKAWQEYATPGDPHKKLEGLTGTWTTKVKAWMDPTKKDPEVSEGSTEYKMIHGGRYMEIRYQGNMMGQPFSGLGYTGYDNGIKKYQSFWIDNMGTGMMMITGGFDKGGTVLTMTGTMDDFMTKKKSKVKETITFADADHHKMEMWGEMGGKMVKSLEIDYTRKK